jgi:tetratricopeptide (TPR) repeat protein
MLFRRRRSLPFPALQTSLVLASSALLGCSGSDDAVKTTVAKPVVNQSAERAQQRVEAGKRLASEGQHERAVEEFTQALKELGANTGPVQVESPDAEILYQRGLAYLEMGFPDTAAEDFTAVIAARPNFGPAYTKRGRSYCELGDLYRSVRDCTAAIRLDANSAEAYRYRGVAYMRRAQHDRSVTDLEHAINLEPALEADIKPQLAEAYRRWGRALTADGNATAAAEKLAKARALDPAYVEPQPPVVAIEDPPLKPVERTAAKPVLDEAYASFEKGRELQDAQRHDEALIEFTKGITIHPEFFDAYLRRGETLLALGFPDTAIKDFNEALRLNDQSAEAYRLQAAAFARLGNHYRSAMSATDALHVDPADAQTYAVRGAAYLAMRNWDRAIADLEEAGRRDAALKAQLAPTLAAAYRDRAAEEQERREHAEADEAIRREQAAADAAVRANN